MIPNTQETARRRAIAKLDDLGFFRYVRAEDLESVVTRVVETGDPYQDDIGRVAFLDLENILEIGFGEVVTEMGPLLSLRGIEVPCYTQVSEPNGHWVTWQRGRQFIPTDRSPTPQNLRRALGAVLGVVDSWLANSTPVERTYAELSYNDSLVVLLTDEMFAVVADPASRLVSRVVPGVRLQRGGGRTGRACGVGPWHLTDGGTSLTREKEGRSAPAKPVRCYDASSFRYSARSAGFETLGRPVERALKSAVVTALNEVGFPVLGSEGWGILAREVRDM